MLDLHIQGQGLLTLYKRKCFFELVHVNEADAEVGVRPGLQVPYKRVFDISTSLFIGCNVLNSLIMIKIDTIIKSSANPTRRFI